MGFFDQLAANPGNSGVYGSQNPERPDPMMALQIVNRLRDRDMNDFKEKQNFMSDLSQRQPNMRQVFSPTINNGGGQNQPPMDTVLKDNTQPITPFQREGLNIDKSKLGLEGQKVAQSAKFGEERISADKAKQDLDTLKNKQIYDTKQADMQRKVEESQAKLELAQKTLEQKGQTAEGVSKFKDAQLEAIKAQRELDNNRHDAAAEEATRLHDAQIAAMQGKTENSNRSDITTTSLSPDQQTKTVTKSKGSSRIKVIHPDGTPGTIDASEADKATKAGWKVVQ